MLPATWKSACGTIANDATWTAAIAYAVTNNITVKGTDGADSITTLTLQPGAVLKNRPEQICERRSLIRRSGCADRPGYFRKPDSVHVQPDPVLRPETGTIYALTTPPMMRPR